MLDEFGIEYLAAIALWGLALFILLGQAWMGSRPVAGLALAYWVNLSIIHLIAGLIQLLPGYMNRDRALTIQGFTLTGYCMAGFVIGLLLPKPVWGQSHNTGSRFREDTDVWLAGTVILYGLLIYFVGQRIIGSVASVSAVLGNSLNVTVAGFCLLFWIYYSAGNKRTALLMMGWVLIVPVLTVVLLGFLGFGIGAVVSVAAFVGVKYSPRRTVLLGGGALFFIFLSLYITYMSVRTEIRQAVWGEEALAERLSATSSIERKWTWADLDSPEQLAAIEGRLNQNYLVGAARANIESHKVTLAEGETIWQAFVALIPRMIWPDKPQFAGSGTLVARFTGMQFAQGTSVGIGHIMELYVNFGTIGVLVGSILIAWILSIADQHAGRFLQAGKVDAFLKWYVAGSSLLGVGGAFAEAFPAAVGSLILCWLLSRTVLAGWTKTLVTRDGAEAGLG